VPAHEIIVVDDGSTDATPEVLHRYRNRIVYLRQENRGAPAAENAAIRRATGDFVAILDADDVYERDRLEALTELAAERPDLDMLMTDAYFDVGGKIVGRFCDSTRFAVVNQNLEIFERCFVAWPAVRRQRLLAVGGFDESLRVGYDWECWIRLLHSGSSAGIVLEPLMRYRIKGDTSLTDDRVAALRARVRVLELASRLDLSVDERGELKRFLSRRRRRALLAETEQALRRGSPDARRRSVDVALAHGMPAATRIRGLAAALAPRTAARRLAALEARGKHSRIRRRLPSG
jgi:glycosyltransferase involved in cell wall biosynthesis